MQSMNKPMILYRGSLKSCNYRCSYCPFSKRRSSEKELLRDREQWLRFCKSLTAKDGSPLKKSLKQPGAVMVTPYGEALLHPWYWEGLASLSVMESIDAVGAQTNLSFSPKEALACFDKRGGQRGKLRLWATFHPEMVSIAHFAGQCRLLLQEGVLVCAGAVGVPENLDLLKGLKKELPEGVYLWINRMDGLKRPYKLNEILEFEEIDPFFSQELQLRKADRDRCQNRVFVEGDGTMKLCSLCHSIKENWYETDSVFPSPLTCRRSTCSCFLAYGGRDDYEYKEDLGPYPLFRIPHKT